MCAISFQSTSQQQYHDKTNAGLIAGSILAGTQVIGGIIENNNIKNHPELEVGSEAFKKELENLKKLGLNEKEALNTIESMKNGARNYKKYYLPIVLGVATLSAVSGAIVDRVRNKKASEAYEAINKKGVEKALDDGHHIRLTEFGTPYYKSNDGSKLGGLLGAGVGLLSMSALFATKSMNGIFETAKALGEKNLSKTKIVAILGLVTLPVFALGGWVMGNIADNYNNRKAEEISLKNYKKEI